MAEFGIESTAEEVLAGRDLTGTRALVTGVSAGIGVETARALLAHGAQVIGTARDPEKAAKATAEIRQKFGGCFTLMELDLASLASVRACAEAVRAQGKPLHLIITNAGVMATPFEHTRDGFELQLGTNHLGHFVLANRLVGLMPAGARLVSLSSAAHHYSDIDLSDPNYERRPYDRFMAYGASKTAITLAALEFDRRHKERGVRAIAVHPGAIMTELMRHMTPEIFKQLTDLAAADAGAADVSGFKIKTIPQGAATSIWAAAVAPADEVGGKYCEDCHVGRVTQRGSEGVRPYAVDPEHAKALWAKSEELVGERFI